VKRSVTGLDVRLFSEVTFTIAAGEQRGRVVEIIEPGQVPDKGALRALGYAMPSGGIGTRSRSRASYVVSVEQGAARKPIAYWPKKVEVRT
jgi:hypothetical protein